MSKTFSQIRLEQSLSLMIDDQRTVGEITVRCPYCGDSKKNPMSAHLGIKFGNISIYHCFKCDVSGVVNAKFLKDMKIEEEMIKKFIKFQKTYAYLSPATIKEVSMNKGNIVYNFNHKEDSPQYKYLSERFKLEFTEEDIKRYRVILDPMPFLSDLSSTLGREIKPAFDLSNHIGFLTQDGKQAVFRAIKKEIEPRFYNFTIEETDYRKLYVIDNGVNLKSEKFNFVLTEGIFDIIGVYEHFYKHGKNLDNTIFVAALGKSFHEPINRLVQSGFIDFDIYLFADSSEDIDLNFYKELFNNEYIEDIHVARNKKEGEKDFGVSLDRIEFDDFEVINRKKLGRLLLKNKDSKKKA